jgi:zinc protease
MTIDDATLSADVQVQETVLDNGLKVLIQEEHTAPVAAFMVWYKVGSRNETSGISGISHLLEHMMFKGTPTYAKGEIGRLFQKNGASFNAGTSLDYTVYYEVLASDRLELAMQIESDRMANASIPDEEHRLEMTVVRSELERNEDDPHHALYTETFAQAFKAHPYHWPTIGWRTDVEQITTEQIRAYYRTYYKPNNATVVIVGDVDPAKALAMVKRYFGPVPRGEAPPPMTIVEPPQQGERRFKMRRPGDTRYLMVSYKNPAMTDPDSYALDVLGMILGHGKTSRLYRGLVETKLATDADASNETARDPFLLIATVTVAPEATLEEVEAALHREIERMKREPATGAELARAKRQVEASFVYAKDSMRSLAQQLGYFETVGSYRYLDTYIERIEAVTPEDVQRVARKYLVEDARIVGCWDPIPTDAAGPGGSAPAGVGGPGPVSHAYREEAPAAAPLAAEEATAHRTVLPNGLTLVVRENHANPTVSLQGLVKAGAALDPPGKSGLSTFVASMLDKGTERRSAFEQAAVVESLGASLRFDGSLETVLFSGRCLSPDLETVLDALADALRNPAFPDDAIENARAELITDYNVDESSTAAKAARVSNELLYPPGHPYHDRPGGTDTTLKAITRQDLVSFHRARFGPNATILVLVGDVAAARAADLVARAFGDWKRIEEPPSLAATPVPPPARVERRVVPMPGKSQADIAYAVPGLARTDPDFDAAMIMNYILGGGSLTSRLMDEVRDKQGLVYGIYSFLLAGLGAGPLQIRAGTNPANVDRCVDAMMRQIAEFHDRGPTEQEMEDAKDYITGVFPVRLETNAGVAGQLLSADLYGLGLDYIERYPSIIRAVKTQDVAAAARKYLRPDGYALVIAGDYSPSDPRTPRAKP